MTNTHNNQLYLYLFKNAYHYGPVVLCGLFKLKLIFIEHYYELDTIMNVCVCVCVCV